MIGGIKILNPAKFHKEFSPTRGYGLIEKFLAIKRAKIANAIIPSHYRRGRILDIGCGLCPWFLIKTKFYEKYGLDKSCDKELYEGFLDEGITLIKADIEKVIKLDFDSEQFDVITMLAVVEHLEIENLKNLIEEIYRILKPNGIYIITTPAAWTAKILKIMASMKIVSKDEINEHKNYFNPKKLSLLLQETGFLENEIEFRYFEMFANIMAIARKNKEKIDG